MYTVKESDYSISLGFSKKINQQINLGFAVNNLGMKDRMISNNQNSILYDRFEEFGVGISYLSSSDQFLILSDFYFRNDVLVSKIAINTNFPMFNLSIGTTHNGSYEDLCYGFSLNLNNLEIVYGYLVYGDEEQNVLGNPTSIQFSAKF